MRKKIFIFICVYASHEISCQCWRIAVCCPLLFCDTVTSVYCNQSTDFCGFCNFYFQFLHGIFYIFFMVNLQLAKDFFTSTPFKIKAVQSFLLKFSFSLLSFLSCISCPEINCSFYRIFELQIFISI